MSLLRPSRNLEMTNNPQAQIDAAVRHVAPMMEKAALAGVELQALCIVMYAYVETYAEVHDLKMQDIIETAQRMNKHTTIQRPGQPLDTNSN